MKRTSASAHTDSSSARSRSIDAFFLRLARVNDNNKRANDDDGDNNNNNNSSSSSSSNNNSDAAESEPRFSRPP